MDKIKITKLLYKPTFNLVTELIYGVRFAGIKKSPNVYVVETEDDLSNLININFEYDKISYTLSGIQEHDACKPGVKIIECSNWKESYE